jgi:iron complex transport system ATP-binding protein
MNASPDILKVAGLSVRLGGRDVVSGVDLAVRAGEVVVIVGPNGAGKTTLLKAVAGLLSGRGAIAIDDTPLSRLSLAERARRIAYLPQGHLFHWPLAVEDIVALGRLPRGAGADLSETDRAAVLRAMTETGVAEHSGRAVTTLSGGERARVALARVLATEARLILADEPTAALDPRYQLIVLDILRRHANDGGAVVAVLHDLGLAARRADRIVVLDQGRIVADGPPREVLTKPLLAKTFGVNAQIVTLVDAPVVIPWTVTQIEPPAP